VDAIFGLHLEPLALGLGVEVLVSVALEYLREA
jgi:hypothetical protein